MTHRYLLIDIEGVLVVDKSYRPVPGAVAWLNGLADRGISWCLVSNNTTHRPADLVADLQRAGFMVHDHQLVGALGTAVALLQERNCRRLGWLGAPALTPWWSEMGFELVPDTDEICDAVVLGVSPGLDLPQLDLAMARLRQGAALVCLHRNRFWLDADGRPRLGPGAMAAALEMAVPGLVTFTAGKPEPAVYHAALNSLGGNPAEALFISDDPFTDLVGARNLGMATAFVLSGKYSDREVLEELPPHLRPDLVLPGPDQL